MQRKIISKAIIPVFGLVLFFVLPEVSSTYRAAGDLFSDKQEIESLIEAGKLADAQTQTEQLKADYSQDPQLPEALYWIAERYRWEQKWEQANNLHNQIIQDYPDSLFASKANLGIARAEVLYLLAAGDYDGAQQALDELAADFTGHPDLPETLYWTAEGFRWGNRPEKAKQIHEQIMRDYPDSPYAGRAKLAIGRALVLSLIAARNFGEAEQAFDKLVDDFPGHQDLPDALYWIAEAYRWNQRQEKAIGIYQQIVQNYPDSPFASKSRLGLARTEILSLIEKRQYEQADEAIETMFDDFAGHPDLPDTLFWIAEGYRWASKSDKAKGLYQRIIQDFPDSSYADRARLGLARQEVVSLIVLKNFGPAEKALDKFIADFAGHPDLPETLFWIAEGYRWANNSDKAKGLYQQIIQDFPDSSYADRARLGLARQEVVSLIVRKNSGPAEKALDKFIADFAGQLDLPQSVFWIGRQYEWTTKYEEAKKAYELIASQYPNSTFADEARLGVARTETALLIYSGQSEEAQAAVERIKTDFAGHPELADTLYEIAGMYDYINSFEEAIELHSEIVSNFADDKLGSRSSIQEAKLAIFELIDANDYITAETAITQMRENFSDHAELPDCLLRIAERYIEHGENALALKLYEDIIDSQYDSKAIPLACARLIDSHIKQNDYEQAFVYAQRLSNDWPNSEHAWYGLFTIGELNERMKASGLVGDEVDSIIKTCYEGLVANYPDCAKAKYAAFRLAETALEEEDWANVVNYNSFLLTKFEPGEEPVVVLYPLALGYDKLGHFGEALETYKLFIIKANTTDPRRNGALQRITELEATVNNEISTIRLPDSILAKIVGGFQAICVLDFDDRPCYTGVYACLATSEEDCSRDYCQCDTMNQYCQIATSGECYDRIEQVTCSGRCQSYPCIWIYDPETPPFWYCVTNQYKDIHDCDSGQIYDCGL